MKGSILIVDDEPSVRDSLRRWFQDDGFEVGTAEGANDALTRLADRRWDLALVDIRMRGTDGIELQRRMRDIDPELIVIIMTGYASVDTAVAALKNGAYDYITKPLDPDDVAHLVTNALSHRRTKEENVRMRDVITAHSVQPSSIIGRGASMQRVFNAIETVGPTDATVLITGESGTGKELVARAIHTASARRFHPFVAIHCGALTDTLLESELFGHEKGAFTGAQYRKKGKFEIAEGGTVFLDEIGDISVKTQTDLLRVLQEHEITRVGGHQPIKVDFRCVAATNRSLEEMMADGRFRADLFYRLNVFRMELPPLRERPDDIPLLAGHFVRKYASQMNKKIRGLSAMAMTRLQQHAWPGNVRELEHAIERAVLVARDRQIAVTDLPEALQAAPATPDAAAPPPGSLEEIERVSIIRALETSGWNKQAAAALLGLRRPTLYSKMRRHGIPQRRS